MEVLRTLGFRFCGRSTPFFKGEIYWGLYLFSRENNAFAGRGGRYISVALFLRSLWAGVTRYPCPVEPGLSSWPAFRLGHAAACLTRQHILLKNKVVCQPFLSSGSGFLVYCRNSCRTAPIVRKASRAWFSVMPRFSSLGSSSETVNTSFSQKHTGQIYAIASSLGTGKVRYPQQGQGNFPGSGCLSPGESSVFSPWTAVGRNRAFFRRETLLCSNSNKNRFFSTPPAYPVRLPSAPIKIGRAHV